MPDIVFAVLGTIFGLTTGSFLNVCIYRLPRKESLAYPPSHCTECGTRLRPEDLVPVLSYIALRGRCRVCHTRISMRYPLVEVATGVLFLFSAVHAPGQAEALAAAGHPVSAEVVFLKNIIFLSALLVITFIDLDHQIIPDAVTFPLFALGLVIAWFFGADYFLDCLKGAAAGFFGYYAIAKGGEIVFRREAMGGGDVKLAAAAGAFLGFVPMVVGLFFLAFVFGVAAGVPAQLLGGRRLREPIPFGPMMAAGAAVSMFYSDAIIAWWYSRVDRLWG